MARKATFCVVVPAYNEEVVIEKSLRSLFLAINKKHVYVVSDGSTDNTSRIARRILGKNVLSLRKNVGKANAIKKLLTKFSLTKRYQYVMFFDADTTLNKEYFHETKKLIHSEPACIVGTVTSQRRKLISAYRAFEYGFSHRFFKNAQNAMGTITIAPGCTSTYRADVLNQLSFDGGTLTEDFDLTLQIHHQKLGKVVYSRKSYVITQDLITFGDYWKQIMRWNTGYWQNFFSHRLFLPNKKVNFEILLLTGDFFYWFATVTLAVFKPLFFLKLYGTALGIMLLLSITVLAIERRFWAIPYAPLFGIFHLINVASFILSLFRAIFWHKKQLSWQKLPRYA